MAAPDARRRLIRARSREIGGLVQRYLRASSLVLGGAVRDLEAGRLARHGKRLVTVERLQARAEALGDYRAAVSDALERTA